MDYRNCIISSKHYTYTYNGATWIDTTPDRISIPFNPGSLYTLQSLEASFINYQNASGFLTDARVSGYQTLMLSRRDNVLADMYLNSTIPVCRYYKDIPYIDFDGSNCPGLVIYSGVGNAITGLEILLDQSLAVFPAGGDTVDILVRVQLSYTSSGSIPSKAVKTPPSSVNEKQNYLRSRGLSNQSD